MKCVVLATGVGGEVHQHGSVSYCAGTLYFATKCCVRLAASVCIRLVVWMSIRSWGSVNSATIGCDLCRPDLNDFNIQLRMHLFSTPQKPSRTETSTLVKGPDSRIQTRHSIYTGWRMDLANSAPQTFRRKAEDLPKRTCFMEDLIQTSSDRQSFLRRQTLQVSNTWSFMAVPW